jgi:hypothetical protein
MIIKIKREDGIEISIDTKDCVYPYSFTKAITLSLELDGLDDYLIEEIFGKTPMKVESND